MSFTDIAFERLSKAAPELSGLVVSFQDMSDETDESSKIKVGAFILNSSGSLFYIPVIAKGTNAYPMDCIFSEEEKRFFPMSKLGIEKVKASAKENVGQGAKVPKNVVANPSVRRLVEPPRTGKYVYASSGLNEFLTQIPDDSKEAMLNKIAEDQDLTKGLNKVGFDVRELVASLQPIQKQAETEVAPEVQVVTQGEGLDDEVIQMILDQGYAIVGEHREPRVAVELGNQNQTFTTLRSAQPGQAYEVVMKDGLTRLGFVPKGLQAQGLGAGPEQSPSPVGMKPYEGKGNHNVADTDRLFIMENGDYAYTDKAVIKANPRDYIEAVKNVVDSGSYMDIDNIDPGMDAFTKIMLVTAEGCAGPFTVDSKTTNTETGTTIQVSKAGCEQQTIHVLPNMKGNVAIEGKDIYVSPSAKAIKLKKDCRCDIEMDLNTAVTKSESVGEILKEAMTINYDGIEYAVDGHTVGNEVALAEELAVNQGLSKEATEHFIKKAKEESKVKLQLTKQAAKEAVPTPIPDYGQEVPEDRQSINESKKKQSLRVADSIKKSMGTRDRNAIEQTIISEFLQDPNMYETIDSYLPEVNDSVDRLGRAILLLRINSDQISDDMESEDLSNMMTSLRNTFKMLGDNAIKLGHLTSNAREHG